MNASNPIYDFQTINGKDVYTVQAHHHVLLPWSIIRRGLPEAPNLITLDEHTDAHSAFLRHVYSLHEYQPADEQRDNRVRGQLLQRIDFNSPDSVLAAIKLLCNDEHIQAATLSGILNIAFVVHLSGDETRSVEYEKYIEDNPWPQRMLQLSPPRMPSPPFTYRMPTGRVFKVPHLCAIGCMKMPHDDICNITRCNQVLETIYLADQLGSARAMASSVGISDIEQPPYLLDIDLDFFHTDKALAPDDADAFYRLIRNAQAVTIATEEDYTTAGWIDAVQISVPMMLQRLYEHIRLAMATC